jgi:hypothetical protein
VYVVVLIASGVTMVFIGDKLFNVCLLFDALMGILVVSCILKLVRI